MAYEVKIHREALKFYKSLPAEWQLRIDQAVEKHCARIPGAVILI